MRGYLVLVLLFMLKGVSAQSRADSLLHALEIVIKNKDQFVQQKLGRIEALRNQLENQADASLEKRFALYNGLFHEYKVLVYDSAFRYARLLARTARLMSDSTLINYSKAKLCFILVSSGMFKEAFDSLKTIHVKTLPDSSRHEYYWLTARAYFDLGLYNGDTYFAKSYLALGLQALDSALRYCETGGYHYHYYSNYRNSATGDYDKALHHINTLLNEFPITTHQRAIHNHHLGSVYLNQGNEELALEAYLTSAIADAQAAVKENAALNSAADILHRRGNTKAAYFLIEEALRDAVYYGAKQRKIAIGSILPMIAEKELKEVESQRRAWLIYSVLITSLVISTLIFIFAFVRQLRKRRAVEQQILEANENLKEINKQLREADRIKEEYIGYYFNINSDYIERTEETLKAIDQKLGAKKFEDIRYILNNFNLKRERETLFVNFDKVFLKLFPDFVSVYNSHFKPEDQVILKENHALTPELRIYALTRLGIQDTEKIARILGYSVNTIYTYKTKVRSKAQTSKEEFERSIMSIETVQP